MIALKGADRLERLPEALEDLTSAEKAAGAALTARARQRAPVRTGRLRASLRAAQGSVQSNLVYAPPIHWGWRAHNIRANRFAWDAALANEREWAELFAQGIQENLDKLT